MMQSAALLCSNSSNLTRFLEAGMNGNVPPRDGADRPVDRSPKSDMRHCTMSL